MFFIPGKKKKSQDLLHRLNFHLFRFFVYYSYYFETSQ